MPKKYYTVWKIVPGVYYNWEDCHKQIVNFKGHYTNLFKQKKKLKTLLNTAIQIS